MSETLLEALAYERDRRAAQWENHNAEQRRWLILRVLADQAREPLSSDWLLAAEIAARLGIPGSRRLGRGAVAGSWTGYMSPALRITTSLRHSAKQGLVRMGVQPDQRLRYLYSLSPDGLAWLDARPYKL